MMPPFHLSRQTAADYPGVVRGWASYRLVVARGFDGVFYYRLQVLAPVVGASAPGWVAIERASSASLVKLVAKLAASTPGLASAAVGLPDDPSGASPDLLSALAAAYAAAE